MKKLLLIIIIICSLAIRIYGISQTPQLNADESALGYNAYSLIQTGKDEFGTRWPFVFRSFDDYKPGIYVYLAIPFIEILGLNALAVRLPSLIAAIISIWTIYYLAQRIFATSRHKVTIGLISSLILAIMPWHIQFSRGAWETQVATTFLLIGTYFFLLIPKKKKYLFFGLLMYFLALYTYHSMRVLIPLFIFYWSIRYRRIWFKSPVLTLSALVFSLLASIPLGLQIFNNTGLSRAQGVSIFADSGPIWRANEIRNYHSTPSSIWVRAGYNKPVLYLNKFFANYIEHYSLKFLFYEGDVIQRNKVPGFGQLLFVSFIFFIAGIWYLIRQVPKRWSLLVFWLLVSPIPSALTFQSPHAVRAFSLTIPLALVIAYGIVNLVSTIKQKKGKLVTSTVILIITSVYIWDFSRYLANYYLLLPYHYPDATQNGFNQLVPWVESVKQDYNKIIITDQYDQPYILFLFYSQYSPKLFQSQAKISPQDKFGFGTVRQYDNYKFQKIDFNLLNQTEEKILLIGTQDEIPDTANIVNNIYDKYDRIIFRIAQIN